MFSKTMRAGGPLTTALLLTVWAVAGFAQSNQANDPPGKSTLKAELVKTGLYLISGGGCNSLLRLSANGLILVDGKLPGNYDELREQVRKISDQPVRVLINTDYHENHTGNNSEFLADATQILAQENVKKSLAAHNTADGKAGFPTKTYDRHLTLQLGGIEAQILHFGNAHTDGDTVVYFPNLRVVAVGDLFASTPDPDFSAGGSLVGWGPVLAEILKLDFDVVAPGSGPTVTRAELQAYKTRIDTLVSRATQLVRKGVPRDKLMAQLKTDDLGWRLSFSGDRLDHFYGELSRSKWLAPRPPQ
jgi:cyclase